MGGRNTAIAQTSYSVRRDAPLVGSATPVTPARPLQPACARAPWPLPFVIVRFSISSASPHSSFWQKRLQPSLRFSGGPSLSQASHLCQNEDKDKTSITRRLFSLVRLQSACANNNGQEEEEVDRGLGPSYNTPDGALLLSPIVAPNLGFLVFAPPCPSISFRSNFSLSFLCLRCCLPISNTRDVEDRLPHCPLLPLLTISVSIAFYVFSSFSPAAAAAAARCSASRFFLLSPVCCV